MVAPDRPLPCPHIDAGNAFYLASMTNHPKVRLKADDDMPFGVYKDWVHQNLVNKLDDGID